MTDFTLHQYKDLLDVLARENYTFLSFREFLENNYENKKIVILRHDVDRLPQNALEMAKIERSKNIVSSYYFRIVKESNDANVITQIAELGHEIGYHYEDLTITKGNVEEAIKRFKENLQYFGSFYPVKTICMHGSPLSRIDNRDIWRFFDYKTMGIIGEPYFDVDYNNVFYITDTGRKWNSVEYNVRDNVSSHFKIQIKSTQHLISLIGQNNLPNMIMINTHPHRWFYGGIGWYKEYFGQTLKNVAKRIILRLRDEKK
ncbi:MAG: hypothetical protein AB7S48_11320 [Bacteroidales bacterium]